MTIDIAISIISALLLLVCFFLKRILDTTEKRLNAHSERMSEIEDNYITRFEGMGTLINNSRIEVIKEVGEIKVALTAHIAASK